MPHIFGFLNTALFVCLCGFLRAIQERNMNSNMENPIAQSIKSPTTLVGIHESTYPEELRKMREYINTNKKLSGDMLWHYTYLQIAKEYDDDNLFPTSTSFTGLFGLPEEKPDAPTNPGPFTTWKKSISNKKKSISNKKNSNSNKK
jgi:hypothetical protein